MSACVVLPYPKKNVGGGNVGGMMTVCELEKVSEVNSRFNPSFPFSFVQDSISVKTVSLETAAVQHCVYLTS